MKQIFYLLLS